MLNNDSDNQKVMDKAHMRSVKAWDFALKSIREKAQNNVNTLAAIDEILKIVSIDDIIRENEDSYIKINYQEIARHLKECNFLTPAGKDCNWACHQVKRIITRIYEEHKNTTL